MQARTQSQSQSECHQAIQSLLTQVASKQPLQPQSSLRMHQLVSSQSANNQLPTQASEQILSPSVQQQQSSITYDQVGINYPFCCCYLEHAFHRFSSHH